MVPTQRYGRTIQAALAALVIGRGTVIPARPRRTNSMIKPRFLRKLLSFVVFGITLSAGLAAIVGRWQ